MYYNLFASGAFIPQWPEKAPDVSDLRDHSLGSFNVYNVSQESNIDNFIKMDQSLNAEKSYEVIENGAKRGGELLVDKNGYSYSKDGKRNKKGGQRWRCTKRTCKGSVFQNPDQTWKVGASNHTCKPNDCVSVATKMKVYCKEEGKRRPFAAASTIVHEALEQNLPPAAPIEDLPAVSSMVQATNRNRQVQRPKQPNDLKFELVEEALPESFVQCDLRLGQSARHIIMFTSLMLVFLSKAKTWYMDATFKAVQKPFRQLLGIHVFLRNGKCIKQVPLVFALMSRKSKRDYVAVLTVIKENLPHDFKVQGAMIDFEVAVWTAIREVFPTIHIFGCSFHWGQAVWRKIQDLGLAIHYRKNRMVRKFLRQLLCLPFLPAEHIPKMFRDFVELLQPNHPEALHDLCEYIDGNWISSMIWPPSCWSVFQHSIRTNNDVEGYHHALNQKAGQNVNMYELMEILYKECKLVSLQHQLIGEEKLQRYQKKKFQQFQAKIFMLWDQYEKKELTAKCLLEKVAAIYHPVTKK